MAAKTLESRINTDSFSHVSGSIPDRVSKGIQVESFFPREWECSCRIFSGFIRANLFPTQVGVFLVLPKDITTVFAFSHASGSVPNNHNDFGSSFVLFPRKWECSLVQ